MALPADPSDFLGVQRQDEEQKLDQNPQSTFSIALPSDCGTYCTCHCSIKATVGNGKGDGRTLYLHSAYGTMDKRAEIKVVQVLATDTTLEAATSGGVLLREGLFLC